MTSAAIRASGLRTSAFRLQSVPSWAWWLFALVVIGLRTWDTPGGGIYGNIGDSDDMTRLIQVREFMASGHWFVATTMKFGGDAGMLSHWSRLIDLPLAILIQLFSLVMPVEDAERLTHIVWPLSLLATLLWVAYRCVETVAGPGAACIAMVLLALAPSAYYQFAVGRIDHHNAMIAGIASATLIMWSAPYRIDRWLIAGALTGLALAIGYEALAPAVALGVLATVWGLVDKRSERPAGAFALSLAVVFAIAFLATIPPSRWMDVRCDAISLNMVVLISSGVAGLLVAVGPGSNWHLPARLGVIAAFAAGGIAGFGALEPRCLAGPEGQLPALLTTVWLSKVTEAQSPLLLLFKGYWGQSVGLLAILAIGLAAQCREAWRHRLPADIFLLAALAIFVGFACWQFKYSGYATFLSIVPTAIAISRLDRAADIGAPTMRFAAIFFVNQTFLIILSCALENLAGHSTPFAAEVNRQSVACTRPDAVRTLADLPSGLIASNINVGAYIAGLTHHRVLSAPYHRIADAILANNDIFSARDPRISAAVLKQQNVDYVAICEPLDRLAASASSANDTLRADLVNGKAPDYVVAVAPSNPKSLYRVWKVDRKALNLPLSAGAALTP